MVKVKELIERGLELFSRNSVSRLEKFFESAKQENLDISLIDKKYMKFKRTKKKKRFTTIFNYFTFGFSAIGRMANMAYDAERKEEFKNERMKLQEEIKDVLANENMDDNSRELLQIMDFYLYD